MNAKQKIGGQFSGVGAFDQALMRLGIDFENVYQADWDKYARETYLHNYKAPEYYIKDVYDTPIQEITNKHGSLDIMMFSPPCQAFSLAGKRKGEDDKRGVLFYNSQEFIVKNKPRYFIFENVKGLLSDAKGRTFQIWVDMLGGKSVNGNPVIFPREDATPYHIYHKVLNAKHYGVPQNRERVFIVGIRDDADNSFNWPKEQHLSKRLKDVLETDVDKKYYLSDKMISGFLNHTEKHKEAGNGFAFKPKTKEDIGNCITARVFKMGVDDNYLKVKSATKKGYEIATDEDSINFSVPNSETRRVRVGKGVAQTLDTACNQAVMVVKHERTNEAKEKRSKSLKESGKDTGAFADRKMVSVEQDYSDTVLASPNPKKKGLIMMGAIRGRNPENPLSRTVGLPTEQRNDEGLRFFKDGVCGTIRTIADGGDKRVIRNQTIRRLTPRECFRLMDFPDTFTWPVSNSQAYKQAGNSIVVNVLAEILKKLNLK
jgi:DNA (cytosine-5)-methyltransferase 1